MPPPEQQRPRRVTGGDAEINSAAAFSTSSLQDAAIELAANGLAVFPCKWRGEHAKAPLIANGHLKASTNLDQVNAWWSKWPAAMIGTPVPAGCLVLDPDPRKEGTVAALEEVNGGSLPKTLTVWSGRNDGGCHLYFLRPDGPLTSTRLPKGIDLKINGYVIVPPSIHPATDQPYRWDHHPVAVLPYALRELLKPAPRPLRAFTGGNGGSSAGLIRTVASAQEGTRNNALHWAACRAAEEGVLDQIRRSTGRCCHHGWRNRN